MKARFNVRLSAVPRQIRNKALKDSPLSSGASYLARSALAQISGDAAVKLNNLTIAPKLGIVVGVALLGLCVSGGLAGYLMQ